MKIFAGLLFAIMLNVILSFSATADIDYRCLNNCISSKKPSATCLTECSYDPANSPQNLAALKKKKPRDPHDQFTDTYQYDGRVSTAAKNVTPVSEEDYQCMSGCLKNGMQYQYCQSGCLKQK